MMSSLHLACDVVLPCLGGCPLILVVNDIIVTSLPCFPGGYDSDVDREKQLDYCSKTYSNPIREVGRGVKPHQQEEEKVVAERKPVVRRGMQAVPRVATSGQRVEISVSLS